MHGSIYLTFDDGPDPMNTPAILQVLANTNTKATFFLVGKNVEKYPYLVRREVANGMLIGTHSYSHPPAFGTLTPTQTEQEIDGGLATLNALGIRTHWFRPPGGALSPDGYRIAALRGLSVVLWDEDPQDWRVGVTSDYITHYVLSRARPGAVVLMHDGGGDRSATVRALPTIIRMLKQSGLKLSIIGT